MVANCTNCYGSIAVGGATPYYRDVSFVVSGNTKYGLFNSSSTTTMVGGEVSIVGSSSGFAVRNTGSTAVSYIRRTTLASPGLAIETLNNSTAVVSQSTISGGISGSNITCVASDNSDGLSLDSACNDPS